MNYTVTFVSNYINHHQIPFCQEMIRLLGDHFTFLQTQDMEEERLKMGWKEEEGLPYVVSLREDPDRARRLIMECDILLFGWAPEVQQIVERRLFMGRPVFRVSERIYKDGQWKAISPRGLASKWREYTRFAGLPYYLLTAGAYVASDFKLVHAFPDKMYRWGYFPALRTYNKGELLRKKQEAETSGVTQMIWAGRFVDFKHFELVPRLVKDLADAGVSFHLHVAGGGEGEEGFREKIREDGLDRMVTFHGFMAPDQVRDLMETCRVHLFTSDHGEGWGAVVNEAMNSGCAIIAGSEAGCVPFLVQNGLNGVIYNHEDYQDLFQKTAYLLRNRDLQERFGEASCRIIQETWNARVAAERFVRFVGNLLEGGDPDRDLALNGPMSRDPALKPFLRVPEIRSEDLVNRMEKKSFFEETD